MDGAKRAAALTQRLLAFSRLQPLKPTSADIAKAVNDMTDLLRRTLGETIAVETVLAGGLWRAHIDLPQLETAIVNLAINARDAMPDGGRLTIETGNAYLDRAYAERRAGRDAGPVCDGGDHRHRRRASPPRCWARCSSPSSPPSRPAWARAWA